MTKYMFYYLQCLREGVILLTKLLRMLYWIVYSTYCIKIQHFMTKKFFVIFSKPKRIFLGIKWANNHRDTQSMWFIYIKSFNILFVQVDHEQEILQLTLNWTSKIRLFIINVRTLLKPYATSRTLYLTTLIFLFGFRTNTHVYPIYLIPSCVCIE